MSWIEGNEASAKYNLDVDQSHYNVTSSYGAPVYLYTLSAECVKCPFTKLRQIAAGGTSFTIKTASDYSIRVFDKDQGVYSNATGGFLCELNRSRAEFGAYHLTIDYDGQCAVETLTEPVNIYWPLVVFLIVLVLLIGARKGLLLASRKFTAIRNSSSGDVSEEGNSGSGPQNPDNEMETPIKTVRKPRLKSLDCFRGIAIVLMIFCNSGAGNYEFLEHKVWNGLNMADFIFPSFLWIMGVCIPMGVKSQMTRGVTKGKMLTAILRRSITLFLIGLCLNTTKAPNLADIRIFGVLQRFGIAYLVVCSVFVLLVRPPGVAPQNPTKRALYDIILLLPQWLFMLGVVALYLIVTFWLPVPGCPSGYLGPGGMHEYGKYNACIGGATGYIDRVVLGESHLYQHPTAKHVYHSSAFDPEGVFGCLMTIFQVFLGVQAGMILLLHSKHQARVVRWVLWSTLFLVAGLVLCGFSVDDGWIPVNKNMWSLSFVLVTTAVANSGLTLCYVAIDVKRWWSGFPFVYCGMNAIVMYIGHSLLSKVMPFHWRIGSMNTHFVWLLENGWNTVLWVGIALLLFRRKIFISV